MKKIVLMPTKNDAWILEKTLPCILLWADYVIIADQNSTDGTIEICKQSPKVTVLQNDSVFHSTKVRQMLLEEARKIEGNNIIFSIDSDEVVTADILTSEFWQRVGNSPIGTAFQMQWVQLWRSSQKYRDDDSIWSKSYKHFAFIDDRISSFTYEYGVNDHNPRVPTVLTKNTVKLDMPKVLHFQFVNWERMLAKQRFYRVQDFIQTSRKVSNVIKINKMYFYAKDESGLKLSNISEKWVKEYEMRGIDLHNVKDGGLLWYEIEVLRWFKKFKVNTFSLLDIWDVDWEKKRKLALPIYKDIPESLICDPRNIFTRLYHNQQWLLSRIFKSLSSIYKRLQ